MVDMVILLVERRAFGLPGAATAAVRGIGVSMYHSSEIPAMIATAPESDVLRDSYDVSSRRQLLRDATPQAYPIQEKSR
ncbi:hypothetical protein [Nonomuraea sp. NPDC005650]|uniref:hypothetical protein n=1 Tax=Nonomuraea sp. NPDC005650 TaxID=3157045 RepID=UPI0033AEB6A7